MHVQFVATTEDLEYVHRRLLERMYDETPALRWAYRVPQFTIVSLAAVGLFFVVQGHPAVRAAVALISAGVILFITRPDRSRQLGRIARKMIREKHPDGASMDVSIRLADGSLEVESPEGEFSFPWAEIEQVEETRRSIDFWIDDGRLVSVQKRVFETDDSATLFRDEALRLYAGAGSEREARSNADRWEEDLPPDPPPSRGSSAAGPP